MVTPRKVALPRLPNKALSIIGMRRVGKTSLVFADMQAKLAEGVPREHLLYLNLEDDRLGQATLADLDQLLEAYYTQVPQARTKGAHLYLDEVQNVLEWERFIRRLLDTEPLEITVTGSSAQLLSREIATSLRGRTTVLPLFPFSFHEALVHKNVTPPQQWPPGAPERSQLRSHFEEYVATGGFPEAQGLPAEQRVRLLRDYIDVAVLRDVVERHGMTNVETLRHIVQRVLRAPAGKMSINKLYQTLQSQGVRTSKDTLFESVAHLEEAFLIVGVGRFTESEAERRRSPRKFYPIDHALPQTALLRRKLDRGYILETMVAIELLRRGYDIGYLNTPSGYEVDFYAQRPGGDDLLVQVCADTSDPNTLTRELRSLAEAKTAGFDAPALLLTPDGIQTADGVDVQSIWSWLLVG